MRKYIWNLFTWFVETISPRHTFHAHFSLLFTVGATAAATLLSALYHRINPSGVTNISLIYILTIILISCYTDKYRYGILAAIFSVFCINYLYTYPFHEFNFTMTGYPFTFLVMYFISIMTSATTFHTKAQASRIKEDEKLIMEAEKEKLRANLLRAVSHDLRTPLTSMIGASSSYLENEEMLPVGEKRELVAQIYEDANWLLHMVENLLSVTRITEGGSNVLKKSPEAAEEVLFDAITTAKKRYPEQQIHALIPDDFLIAPMDPLLIKQVIVNLLENAIRHSGDRDHITLRLYRQEDWAVVEVRDQGHGLSPEVLQAIQAGQAMPLSGDATRGMGIGLSVCQSIIQAHGGFFTAGNHPSGGAVFRFGLSAAGTA